MCRLLGVIANKPVDLEFSLERFKEFSKWNPDGWGIGWYEKETKVFKQGLPAIDVKSELPRLSKEVRSRIIIAHVRKGTGAKPCDRNSHPFKYGSWIFAHNGSINRDYLLNRLNEYHKNALEGETDSEVYFHWILQCIEEQKSIENAIRKAIEEIIKISHTGLNFLLSNGKNLYAFRYSSRSESYYTLFKLVRNPGKGGPMEILSEETKALIRSKLLKGEKAILICSEKLTEENWEPIEVGNLLIVNDNLNIKEVKMM